MRPHQHYRLLQRTDRALALREAIKKAVRPGCSILDAGCGTGLLSIWAACAGAARVLAVDLDVLDVARGLVAENQVGDRVELRRGDLAELEPDPRGFDLVIAMIYDNDPRRDEVAHALAQQLADRFLVEDGTLIPDRVTYDVAVYDWPEQDLHTRSRELGENISKLEESYGVGLRSFYERLWSAPEPEFFPRRDERGQVARAGARLLGERREAFGFDYRARTGEIPSHIEVPAAAEGTGHAVVWTQRLRADARDIFENESVSWVLDPAVVSPGESLCIQLDDDWRRSNILKLESRKRRGE